MTEPTKDIPHFFADGGAYSGGVFEDTKGKPFGEVDAPCFKCRGNGYSRFGRRCSVCNGQGTVFDQVRVYTADDLAKRNKNSETRKDKKRQAEADRQALVANLFAEFVVERQDFFDRVAALPANRYVSDVMERAAKYGSLSESQMQTLEAMVDRHEAALETFAKSQTFAEADESIERTVTCVFSRSFTRDKYKGGGTEVVYVTEMRDDEGNALVTSTPVFKLDVGQRAVLSGTVKAADASQGWVRTMIIRPKATILEATMDPDPPHLAML